MNILSLITHPHVVPNLYKFLSYVEHKEDILKSQAVFPIDFHSIYFPTVEVIDFPNDFHSIYFPTVEVIDFPNDFHSIYFPTVEVNGTINCSITSIFLNIFFYVEHKKETHTVLERHEGE